MKNIELLITKIIDNLNSKLEIEYTDNHYFNIAIFDCYSSWQCWIVFNESRPHKKIHQPSNVKINKKDYFEAKTLSGCLTLMLNELELDDSKIIIES